MRLGIFAKTFVRPTLEQTLDAVVEHDLHCVQFNLACARLASLPDEIPPELRRRIRREMESRRIEIAAVSGTFNLIHPDLQQRRTGLRRLGALAEACGDMGTRLITLCTGTRDPQDMWRHHPESRSAQAWRDLCDSMAQAIELADKYDLLLGIEPEISNVVDSAQAARRLLSEMKSDRLKIVIDGANLFPAGTLPRMSQILTEAFDLLGGDIAMAHAKDLSRAGEAGHEAAGTGVLDYDLYLELLDSHGFDGPLILHGLSEEQVPASVAFVRNKLDRSPANRGGG